MRVKYLELLHESRVLTQQGENSSELRDLWKRFQTAKKNPESCDVPNMGCPSLAILDAVLNVLTLCVQGLVMGSSETSMNLNMISKRSSFRSCHLENDDPALDLSAISDIDSCFINPAASSTPSLVMELTLGAWTDSSSSYSSSI